MPDWIRLGQTRQNQDVSAGPLTQAFCATAPGGGSLVEGLETELAGAIADARGAVPELLVDEVAFARYLGERVPEGPSLLEALAELRVRDLYLAYGCTQQDPVAMHRLDEMLRGDPRRASARVSSEDLADEALQVLRERLLVGRPGEPAKIADYLGRGPLIGWLCAAAVRTALSLRRTTGREVSAEENVLELELELPEDAADLRLIRERFRVEFAAAFREAVASLDARSRTALRMHVIDGLNIDRIGGVYGVHRATVARWIARAREAILVETRRKVAARLGLADAELDSLFRLVDGQLEVSLTSVLR